MVSKIDSKARIKRLKLKSDRLVNSFFAGSNQSIFKGHGLEFHEARPYVIGDDIRFIDWNVSSRMASPFCKVFKEERELLITIIIDLSASVTKGFSSKKKQMAEEIFALLGFAAINNGDKVGSLSFTENIEHFSSPKRGTSYFLSQLKTIISLSPKSRGSNMALALRQAGELMKRRGICIIISDFKTENYWRELSSLSRHNDVVAIRLEDELDRSFPKIGYLKLGDVEENLNMSVFPSSKKFQDEYNGYWETMRSLWRRNCHKRKVETLIISTKDDAANTLLTFFKRRGKRK